MKLRVVVADDNANFLQKFVQVLGTEFDVVGEAMEGKTALDVICKCLPDVAVLDLEMPELNGLEVARGLVKSCPEVAIVICSVNNDPDIVAAALEAGALGYVFKSRTTRDLIAAVKSAARGEPFVSSP